MVLLNGSVTATVAATILALAVLLPQHLKNTLLATRRDGKELAALSTFLLATTIMMSSINAGVANLLLATSIWALAFGSIALMSEGPRWFWTWNWLWPVRPGQQPSLARRSSDAQYYLDIIRRHLNSLPEDGTKMTDATHPRPGETDTQAAEAGQATPLGKNDR